MRRALDTVTGWVTFLRMSKDAEPTQTTEQGAEIPVPERDDVMAAFRKVAKANEMPADEPEPDEDQ